MRTVVVVMALVGAGASAGFAGQMYRWVDGRGVPHWSNVPTPGAEVDEVADGEDPIYTTTDAWNRPAAAPDAAAEGATDVVAEEGAPPADAVAAVSPDGNESATGGDAWSVSASLRRKALERELRDAKRQLTDLEKGIATQASARTRNARGTAATGGVGSNAAGYLSDEEKSLLAQKSDLEKQIAEIQKQYGALRAEVVARLGSTPDWWRELR